jgi:DNA-nicking Smr family endonuclease
MSQDISFLEELGDVKPIKQDTADVGKKTDMSASIALRREAAVIETREENYLSTSQVKEIGPYDVASFKRDGIQEGVFRKLRLGKYDCDARLDLHRMTVEQSRKAIYDFIQECMEYQLRTVLLLHGKGDKNADKKAILKSYAAHWLAEIPEVMAFHSAQPQHGGTGAMYVLLRKSDAAKNHNRERHGVRS